MKFFQSFEQIIDNELTNIISTQLVLFADQMVSLIQLGVPILILYYGYSIMSGRGSNATVSEMMWNLARIGMIFAFMQNTGNLLDLSIDFIQELKGGFVGADNVFGLLDKQVESTKKLAEDLYSLDVNYIPLKGFLAAGMLWLGSIFVVVAASIIYISSSVCLTLLLATAPIFIGCLSYGFLKENFNGWLRAILSCIASLIFASMISRIGVSLNGQFVQYVSQSPDKSMLLEVGALNLATGIIIGFLLLKSTGLAGSIAGVAASSAIQGGMTAIAAATTTRGVSSTIQGGRNLKSNVSTSVANRAKLAESVQKAAAERVKQNNLK